MPINGIDVSKWQGLPDWNQVKTSNIAFAILNILSGQPDTSFEHNYAGTQANGIATGVYAYSYALNKDDALKEAETVLKLLKNRKLTLPVFYDLEWDEQAALGKSAIEQIAVTFLDKVSASGYQVGIYCNTNWWNNYITDDLKNKYKFWIASVAANDTGQVPEKLKPGYGIGWQYSWKGKIAGINGDVDLNLFYSDDIAGNSEVLKMSKIEMAVKQMEVWAADDSHGYDQIYRWGEKGDYDCSSAIIESWQMAGVPVKAQGATYTGNMRSVFLKCGFRDITASVNRVTGEGLQRGDVLLNTLYHTAMFCGDNKEVEASINEKGTAVGGIPGDQNGKEFLVRAYRNYPWDFVLRYVEEAEEMDTVSPVKDKLTADGSWGPATTKRAQVFLKTVVDGIISNQPLDNKKYLANADTSTWMFKNIDYAGGSSMIKALQKLIGATPDGWFGKASVLAFQKYLGIAQDGSMGPATVKTWQNFLNNH